MIRKGIAVCAIAGLLVFAGACRRATSAVDLMSQFDGATKQPAAGQFAVQDVDLNGERKKAIVVPPDSRLTFKVQGRRFRLTDVHGHILEEVLA